MRRLALPDDVLLTVEKPQRYIGGEYNSYNKDFDAFPVRVVFCFPDVYEIGTANLGMQIIYEQFNRRNDAMCDRVYNPWPDCADKMRERSIPLFAVESQRPVKNFDFLLITLSYELCYTNVLELLDLAGIPLFSKERSSDDPIVIGGGACAVNPEPIAPFFDVFYIGEAETEYDHMVEVYKDCLEKKLSREDTLRRLAKIPGLYVPRFYDVRYNEDGTIASFGPNDPEVPKTIRRQAVREMDGTLPYPLNPIVPFDRGFMDRATLEVMRGCIRGCRFCQAGVIYRPTRNRNLEFLKKAAVEMLRSSGYDEVNLSSLATSDYSDLKELLEFLVPYCEARHINIGIPSLRIDSFSLDVMGRIQDVKKSSLTFAPEAGTQRLRNVINKGLTEEEILSGAAEAFRGGWTRVKLYFMLGQPFETDEDVRGIPELSNKIAAVYYDTIPKEERKGQKVQVQASTSFFVPKPFTPFQWAVMCRPEEFLRRAMLVKDTMRTMLNWKSLQYHYHEEDQTELEGLLARGDRRVAEVVLRAWQKGARFDAWSEQLRYDLWLEAMEECGVTYDFYNYRQRSLTEILPWDFIDAGVSKGFLRREWERASRAEVTPNCREKCAGCGSASYGGGVCYNGREARS